MTVALGTHHSHHTHHTHHISSHPTSSNRVQILRLTETPPVKANVSQTRAVTPWNRNALWSKSSQTQMLHAVCATQSNLYMLPLTHARRHLHNSLTQSVNLPVLCKSGQQNAIGKCHASAETSVPIRSCWLEATSSGLPGNAARACLA